MTRDHSVDDVRGLAIFTMIAANAAGPLMMAPHPFGFRLYGSFAAAIFTFVAGMMVALTSRLRGHRVSHYVTRGALVIAVAVLIDLCVWKIVPFTTCDVLYLIAISLPLTRMALDLSLKRRLALTLCVFALAPVLRYFLGYVPYVTEWFLTGQFTTPDALPMPVWRNWVVDGWFPLFPWLGFPLLGSHSCAG